MGGSLPLASASLNSPDFIRQESFATPSHFIMDFCLFEPYLFFVEYVLYGLQLLTFSMTTNIVFKTVLLFFIHFFMFSQNTTQQNQSSSYSMISKNALIF